jgi:hypothetical protein
MVQIADDGWAELAQLERVVRAKMKEDKHWAK